MKKILFLIILSIIPYTGYAKAAVYSYVDRNGVMHFTNVPTNNKYKLLFRDLSSYNHEQIAENKLKHEVMIIADKYNIDPLLIMAMIKVESDYMPDAVSSAGAVGLMQVLPSTAELFYVKNLYSPKDNIEAGVEYFKYLYTIFNGDYVKAIAAYNAGEQAVLKYKGIPPYPETQWYVAKVLKTFFKMKGYIKR
ncbi:MAG: lytic transglycosylase domain-containing protein [Deltaproteobacteria bacterium]|nr:lytic transglycosylase domain-containing protein [Deltaproteobacteria bacterium]MCL5793097.1 lytic transglycosylase domain-containing protein [Deltaproteobacteria bacterium]